MKLTEEKLNRWTEALEPVILEARDNGEDDSREEPLERDRADILTDVLRAIINLHEGNITQSDFRVVIGRLK